MLYFNLEFFLVLILIPLLPWGGKGDRLGERKSGGTG